MDLKRGFLFGIGAMIALSLVFIYAGNALATESPSAPVALMDKDKTITVTGNGYMYAEPDMAKITIGVTTESDTSTDAMSKNADLMNAVMSAVKSAGIPAKDIRTTRVSVDPVYNYNAPKPKITGYRATNTITVTVRDTSKVGPVIDAAYKAGANDINGVNFMLSEEKSAEVYKQALDKAIAEGADKAKTIASAAGIANPQLKSVTESSSYTPPVPLYAARAADTAGGAATPISTGEERVQATVTMVYTFA